VIPFASLRDGNGVLIIATVAMYLARSRSSSILRMVVVSFNPRVVYVSSSVHTIEACCPSLDINSVVHGVLEISTIDLHQIGLQKACLPLGGPDPKSASRRHTAHHLTPFSATRFRCYPCLSYPPPLLISTICNGACTTSGRYLSRVWREGVRA
jgi:hypothetical protein